LIDLGESKIENIVERLFIIENYSKLIAKMSIKKKKSLCSIAEQINISFNDKTTYPKKKSIKNLLIEIGRK
jgi:hypothetical protein